MENCKNREFVLEYFRNELFFDNLNDQERQEIALSCLSEYCTLYPIVESLIDLHNKGKI